MFRTYSAIAMTLALLPVAATAQSGATIISGLVKDESGAIIPGASIHVVNEDTSVAQDVFSDEQGSYRASDLVPPADTAWKRRWTGLKPSWTRSCSTPVRRGEWT